MAKAADSNQRRLQDGPDHGQLVNGKNLLNYLYTTFKVLSSVCVRQSKNRYKIRRYIYLCIYLYLSRKLFIYGFKQMIFCLVVSWNLRSRAHNWLL